MPEPAFANVALKTAACCTCGVYFAMPEVLFRTRQEDGQPFYCPNGHELAYGEGRLKQLEREVLKERTAKAEAERALGGLRTRLIAEEFLRVQAEKTTARLEQRVAGGVCPHCNRSFRKLGPHMKSKHPEIGAVCPEMGVTRPGKLPEAGQVGGDGKSEV